MMYVLFFLPPAIALIAFFVALKKGFHKPALVVTLGMTMVLTMFAMRYLTWYGVICCAAGSLAVFYIVICLILSLLERRQ